MSMEKTGSAIIIGGSHHYDKFGTYEQMASEMENIRMLEAASYGNDSERYKSACEKLDGMTPDQWMELKARSSEKHKKERDLARAKAKAKRLEVSAKEETEEEKLAKARARARELIDSQERIEKEVQEFQEEFKARAKALKAVEALRSRPVIPEISLEQRNVRAWIRGQQTD